MPSIRVLSQPSLVITAILFSFLPDFAVAQRSGFNAEKQAFGDEFVSRMEFGGGLITTSASFQFDYLAIDTSLAKDTSMSFTDNPTKIAYRLHWGSGRSLSSFGNKSALVLSFGLSYEYLQWAIPEFEVRGRKRQFNFFSHTFGSEIFFDYKTGAEATLDPEKRVSLNLGAGILPAVTRTNGDNNSKKLLFTMRPAIRAEFGFVTNLVNVKLQAMGIWGNVTYVNAKNINRYIDPDAGLSETYDIEIKGQSQFVLSVILGRGSGYWGGR